jgi:uncharacterized membrane protein YbhN (UPF0104 family)
MARLLLLARLAVAALLLFLVLRGTDLRAVWRALAAADVRYLAAAAALLPPIYWLRVVRWRLLLAGVGIHASFGRLLRLILIGGIFDGALPSPLFGDTVRAYASWQEGASKAAAVAAVLMDRCVGFAALLACALPAALVLSGRGELAPGIVPLVAGLAGAAAVAAWLLLAPPRGWDRRLRASAARPRTWRVPWRAAAAAALAFSGRRAVLARAFGASLLLQGLLVVACHLLARAVEVRLSFAEFLVLFCVAVVVTAVPISISGIGVRERIWALLLAGYGYPTAQAVAFAWLLYALVLAHALAGAAVYAATGARRREPRRAAAAGEAAP